MIQATEFVKVDSLLSGVKGLVSCKKAEDAPEEEVLILSHELHTMDDGVIIDLCLWVDTGWQVTVFDISADKTLFPDGVESFLKYLDEKGFYLKNIEDREGHKWKYLGSIRNEKAYRIQYYRTGESDL